MRIMVDLDGVVYRFDNVLREWLVSHRGYEREALPETLTWTFFSEQWGMSLEQFLRECNESVDAGFMFLVGAPVEGSVETLEVLRAAGHTLHICTDRSFGSRSVQNTETWLREQRVPYDSLTFSADKMIVDAGLYIDDRDKNIVALRAAGKAAATFDRPWNRHVDGLRVFGWRDVLHLVHLMEAP